MREGGGAPDVSEREAAHSNTVVPDDGAVTGSSATRATVFTKELVSALATLFGEVPVVGAVCKTFLSFELLVDTARSNKEELLDLRSRCDDAVKTCLPKTPDHSDVAKGSEQLEKLKEVIEDAKKIAERCDEDTVTGSRGFAKSVKRLVVARKISKDITLVRQRLQELVTMANLDVSNKILGTLRDMMEKIDEEEEQRRVSDLANGVEVPPEAPRIREWYIQREAVVSKARDLLGIRSSGSAREEPRMVGLAGPSGAGKSTVASMIVHREDVRAHFNKGVLWLRVGRGAKGRLPELMCQLARMVYETVLLKTSAPPPKASDSIANEDGAAYIRAVVGETARRFLVVADDVWEEEVLTELKRAGVWVLYTTRQDNLLPEAPLRLDQVTKEEAEMVLRRAAELDGKATVSRAANDLMELCEYGVMYLAFAGRWGVVREVGAWEKALDRIAEAQKMGEGGKEIPWRAAMLRAGLDELPSDNPQNKELFLALALVPKGLAFQPKVAAVLLNGDNFSPEELKAAERVAASLERWSILTLEGGGKYRVHDDYVSFILEHFEANRDLRDRALPRWKGYMSSDEALREYSSYWLVKIWDVFKRLGGSVVSATVYDAALGAMTSEDLRQALGKVARFHWRQMQWSEASAKNSQLCRINEGKYGRDSLETASTLYSLAGCAYKQGGVDEAERLYDEALATRMKKLGAHDLDVSRTLYSLAVCVLSAEDRTEKADDLYSQALAIRNEKLGVNHPEVGKILHSLGACVGEKAGQQAHDMREDGVSSSTTKSTVTYAINPFVSTTERAKKAERVLAAKREADFPESVSRLYSRGAFAFDAGRMDEAKDLFQQALANVDELSSFDLTEALSKLGHEETETLLRRMLVMKEEKHGANHPEVASTLRALALCAKNSEEAEKFQRQAVAIQEGNLRHDPLDIGDTLHELGVLTHEKGWTNEAQTFLRQALAIREAQLAANHLDVASTLHELGLCAKIRGGDEEARMWLRRALAIREERLDAFHKDVASTKSELDNIGVCALGQWRGEEAKALLVRATSSQAEALRESEAPLAANGREEEEEQRGVSDLANGLEVPPEAPRIEDRNIQREAVASKACDLLGIRSSGSAREKPRMVGLAGPSGAGKSTVASMIFAREDVRAHFNKRVLWLSVGRGAKGRLPELMLHLARMVYETVLLKTSRPPPEESNSIDPEERAAYIREVVVGETARRFLVVADDVWEKEVLTDLKKAGVWVLYTTRQGKLLPEAPLRLDQVVQEEAEMV